MKRTFRIMAYRILPAVLLALHITGTVVAYDRDNLRPFVVSYLLLNFIVVAVLFASGFSNERMRT